jgi:flavin reductase (DIM6/NTAB) family NADH-FMN oxidoreductase RutF
LEEVDVKKVDPARVAVRPFELLDLEWALLVAGKNRPNPMTVSWGGLGTLWQRPMVTVYVRPTRFTYSLLVAHPEFTLNFLPESRHEALDLCGTRSGRDLDKWDAAKIEKVPSELIAVPRVGGAELSLECRVLSTLDVDPARFLDPALEDLYPARDYHRVFLGEVLAAWAGERFAPGNEGG